MDVNIKKFLSIFNIKYKLSQFDIIYKEFTLQKKLEIATLKLW